MWCRLLGLLLSSLAPPRACAALIRRTPLPSSTQIFGFFRGYRYLEHSLRLDALNNRSSGTATLDFESPREAKAAVRDLHRKYIGRRYIELSLA